MKRSRLKTTDPKKARRQRREWRERAARRYEERLAEEYGSRFRTIEPNRERQKKERERAYGSEERVRWMKMLPCLVCRKCPTEVAHVKSRGAGGTAADTVPLCGGPNGHHAQQHRVGIETFQRIHGLDLQEEARKVEEAWNGLR